MVHSVRSMLAHRVARVGDLSFRLAVDTATSYFWNRRSWSFELDQCSIFSTGAAASRPARHLTRLCPPMDYSRVSKRSFR